MNSKQIVNELIKVKKQALVLRQESKELVGELRDLTSAIQDIDNEVGELCRSERNLLSDLDCALEQEATADNPLAGAKVIGYGSESEGD